MTKKTDEPVERSAHLLMDLIPALHRSVFRHGRSANEANPTASKYRILGILSSRDALSLTELARRCGVTKTNLSPIAERLVSSGFLSRATDMRDRRIVRFSITREGRKHLAQGMAAAESRLRDKISVLSGTDRLRLLDSLETLIAVLEKASQEASDG